MKEPDAGTFGGPINTPNYSRMAARRLRYNRFHATLLCPPTQAALLTWRNNHAISSGSVGEFSTSSHQVQVAGRVEPMSGGQDGR
jgi:arylsulfatase A-like enzyme